MSDTIKIRNVFREIFDDEEMIVSDETNRNDIEDWDSVTHIKLVLALEEEFGVRLTLDEVASVVSVGDFRASIHKHLERET